MPTDRGGSILAFLHTARAAGRWSIETDDASGADTRWRLRGRLWRAEVIVEPRRWLGLTFEAAHPETRQRIGYEIDTDLYDIARGEEGRFAARIESGIVEFLHNLDQGHVLIGRAAGKVVLVFPSDGVFIRSVAGSFVTTTSRHAREAAAVAGGVFSPLV